MSTNEINSANSQLPGSENSNETAAGHPIPHIEQDDLRQEREILEDQLWARQQEEIQKRRLELLKRAAIATGASTVGFIFLFASLSGRSIFALFRDNLELILGVLLIIAAFGYIAVSGVSSSSRLQDVDLRRRLENRLAPSPVDAWPFSTTDMTFDEAAVAEEHEFAHRNADAFTSYFREIKYSLEQKAADAEEKASLLLDKGTAYTIGGIIFFVISIISWQALAWIHGFKQEFIYGIVSCSALFIFIEFLSGWYLKQYRQYVDTSTYLIKVKAIFDRYMLAYSVQTFSLLPNAENQQKKTEFMLQMLDKDFPWPESYILKFAETNFAADATGALSKILKDVRIAQRNKKK